LPPALLVKAPNGGEAYLAGEVVPIEWSATPGLGEVEVLVRRAGLGEEESPGAAALPILDFQTLQVPFEVAGAGSVEALEVGLRLDHTYTADLEVRLVAPDGESVRLAFHNGGWRNDFGSGATDCTGTLTVFADDATTSIDAAEAPFAGRHRPHEPLSALAGQPMAGTWLLEITDHWGWDEGSLFCSQLTVFGETALVAAVDADDGAVVWTPSVDLVTGDFLVELVGQVGDRSDGTFHVVGIPPATTTLPPTTTTTTTTTLPPTTTTTLPPTTTTLPPTTTTTTTEPPSTDLVVQTGYTADEYAGIARAAAILDLEVEEFQRTGVYVVSFLTAINPTPPEPMRPRPPVDGPALVATIWTEEEIPMLLAVAEAWGLTPAEMQKFGAILLAFFVGLAYG